MRQASLTGEGPQAESTQRPVVQAAPAGEVARILVLQRTAGNAAVCRALLARRVTQSTDPNAPDPGAPLAGVRPQLERGSPLSDDVELLQLKLNYHLGFMRRTLLHVDGDFGGLTAGAVRVFKSEHHMRPADAIVDQATWNELDTSPHVLGEAAAHRGTGPEYDRMLADGLLELTLGIGFDEHGVLPHELREVQRGLSEVRGFRLNPTRAAELRAAAGRPATTQQGEVYVKEDYGQSHGQSVHCILTLISPATDSSSSGASARDSALAGMNESDVFMYGGHARYGTGPDFDVDYVITVHWDQFSPARRRGDGTARTGDEQFTDVDDLCSALRIGDNATGVAAFERMEAAGKLEFRGNPSGNVGMNSSAQAEPGTLGAYLISRSEAPAPLPLESSITQRHYRLWMFNGCSTRTYTRAIRGTTNAELGTGELDMIVTNKTTYLTYYAETLLSTLDGLMAFESAHALDDREEQATPEESSTHSGSGFEDNPVAP